MRKTDNNQQVVTPTEARQGSREGLIRILLTSLALAFVAAVFVYAYFAFIR